MPSLWEQFRDSSLNQDYLSPTWDFLTKERFEIPKTGYKAIDLPVDFFVPNSILEGVLSATPMLRAGKYLGKGLKLKAPAVATKLAKAPSAWDKIETLRDEAKQLALTWGIPGTGINYHSLALANANLKSTPLRELPKEVYQTARSLYNPEYAQALNKGLVGDLSPVRFSEEVKKLALQRNPSLGPQGLAAAINHAVNARGAALSNRFADVAALEKAGLRTADVGDIAGATSKGVMPWSQIASKPTPGVNVNPISLAKEMFDEPTFGEGYLNELWKRKAALRELDRARKIGLADPEKQAVEFATTMFGGYGSKNPILNRPVADEIAKWAFVAPDWTRRHINLLGAKAKALTTQWNNPAYFPYRRALGYDAAETLGAIGATKALTGEWGTDRAKDITGVQLPGKYAGKNAIYKPASSEMDAPRVAFDIGNALTNAATGKGYSDENRSFIDAAVEPWRNRIHPFTRTAKDIIFNTDWRGRSLYGKEKWAKTMTTRSGESFPYQPDIPASQGLKNVLMDLATNVNPGPWQAIQSEIQNPQKQSDLEFTSKMTELPFNFYTPTYPKISRRKRSRSRRR